MPKISKLEALRRGISVEKSPGVYARLNPKTKSIEYSTGEVSYVGDDPDYFPRNDKERKVSLEKEKVEKDIESFPLGKGAGEFAYQFGQKGAITGGALDWVERLTQSGEDYANRKEAREGVSGRISGEGPVKSGLATATSFVPDIIATRGMSAMKAAPVLTAAGAGSRVLDEPGQVAGEAGLAAGAGFLLDKGMQFLNRTAGRRGLSRQIAKEAQDVEARNLSGAANVEAENLAQQQAFMREKDWAQREAQARQHQFNLERNARENEMLRARQAYEQSKAAHGAETDMLRQEYQQAQKAYQEGLKELPQRQQAAQRELSQRASKYYDSVTEQLPQGNTFNTGALKAQEFIDTNIRKSASANTAEGKEASRVISSLFGDVEQVSGKELARRLRALDEIIEKSPSGTQVILDQFKRSMGRNIGNEIGQVLQYEGAITDFYKGLRSDISNSLNDFAPKGVGKKELVAQIEDSVRNSIKEMSPQEFMSKLQSGELSEELARKALPKDYIYQEFLPSKGQMQEFGPDLMKYIENSTQFQQLSQQHDRLVTQIANTLDNKLAQAEIQSSQLGSNARRNTSRRFREAYGLAEPVTPPTPPLEPNYPMAPTPPSPLPQPVPPAPVSNPMQPIAQAFSPETMPSLPGARGVAEKAGDLLERPFGELIKGKGYLDLGPLGNVAKLKYLLGSKGLPLAGIYGAAKGLTSPGAAGQALRQSLDKGGMAFIVHEISTSIPSYQQGIILDPNDRKLAVSKIETNPNLGIEDKAQLQAYINRGKSLEKLIRSE